MAIKTRNYSVDGKRVMTVEEFTRWLKRFDEDNDGRISKDELADAIRVSGGWFANRKSKQGIQSVDANGNGFIDDSEIKNLLQFAEQHLNVWVLFL
ncbi:BRI1 kinase inhibitor 1 [Hibiscus syriacus]|uniref:BRI1 kinase inhibitor 1 n=1 Tax=Hibiscus syriacus TaxID=106335 RepID=A0A6A2WIQ2_HIBSY|nr:BRI1 kinase inhibitor 1 [Hibiscus syriacus]